MLTTHHSQKTVDELISMWKRRRLNLSPAFQRQSVWGSRDRQLLIASVLDGVPLPSIYLYKQVGAGGVPKFDVIDGKQRLETILLFLGKGPLAADDELAVRAAFDEDAALEWWYWGDLSRDVRHRFLSTKIATIEVEGGLGEIIDLFVRINSTGKSLTGQEKRHAKYYSNPVLKAAQRLADEQQSFLLRHGVVTPAQAQRMKHVEYVTELLLAVNAGQPLNKKSKIDEIIKGAGLSAPDLADAIVKVRRALSLVEAVLPDLKSTRFRNGTDFYTLLLLLHRYKEEGKAMNKHESRRNKLAGALLRDFARGVEEVSDRLRSGKGVASEQEPFREYLLTVRADTDSFKTRMARERLLRQVLDHVFDDLDSCRLFNQTQRRIVWHASSTKVCTFCNKRIARWEDMSVDHVKPHSRGGKTQLANAALAHRTCNSKAGAKRK